MRSFLVFILLEFVLCWLGHMEITKYGDIFSSRGFITLMIFFKNAVLPSLLLLLLERSFHMNYGYESTNGWFLLIWNITTTIVFIFSMHTIVNILFDKRIGYLPETFIESVKFKRRCIIIVYQIALLFNSCLYMLSSLSVISGDFMCSSILSSIS